MVHRYNVGASPDDGLGDGSEGTFSICSFWLTSRPSTRAGRVDEARLVFEKMLDHTRTTSACIRRRSGRPARQLGNFPQAFTHLSLISAAYNLDRMLGGGS